MNIAGPDSSLKQTLGGSEEIRTPGTLASTSV